MPILIQMKSKRLPPIDACQTSIFQELRDREEGIGRLKLFERARNNSNGFFIMFSDGRDNAFYAAA